MGGIVGGGGGSVGANSLGTSQLNFSANVETFLDSADYAAMRAAMSVRPGTDVQAYDAELAALAGLASAADKVPYFTGSGAAALADFPTFGRSVSAAANLAALLAILGTGTPGSGNYLRGDGSWQAISGGKIAQFVPNFSGAVQTGSGVIPYDDSYPQNNEGSEYYTVAITPTNAGSTLFLLVILHLSSNSASTGTAALFVDSTADAIAAFPYFLDAAECVIGFFVVAASNTSERTYRLRAGQISASTLTVNGSGGSRRYGGSARSGIIAIEVLP